MYIPRPEIRLFLHDDGWSRYFDKYGAPCSTTCFVAQPAPRSSGHSNRLSKRVYFARSTPTAGSSISIHVSVPHGGLDVKHHFWRQLFFEKKEVEVIWRNAVIYLLHDNYAHIKPGSLPGFDHIRNEDRWHRYLHAQYLRT